MLGDRRSLDRVQSLSVEALLAAVTVLDSARSGVIRVTRQAG